MHPAAPYYIAVIALIFSLDFPPITGREVPRYAAGLLDYAYGRGSRGGEAA